MRIINNKMLKYGRLKAKEAHKKEQKFNYLLLIIKPFFGNFSIIILLGGEY